MSNLCFASCAKSTMTARINKESHSFFGLQLFIWFEAITVKNSRKEYIMMLSFLFLQAALKIFLLFIVSEHKDKDNFAKQFEIKFMVSNTYQISIERHRKSLENLEENGI